MVESWWFIGILASFLGGAAGGALAAIGSQAVLKLRVRTLEFAVTDLEERLLREIKTRASHLGVKAKKETDDLLDKITSEPAKPPAPWWAQFVHPDLKQ